MDARQKWDRIYSKSCVEEPAACWVLSEYAYLLPESGRAVDVASGRGGNALLLAGAGLQTTAIDISSVGLEQLQSNAQKRSLDIRIRAESLSSSSLSEGQWDVIVVSNYLQRDLFAGLEVALRPGGLLYYETFVKNKTDESVGPGNPEFLLDDNELLNAIPNLKVRVFIDLQNTGKTDKGFRNRSCLVAQKPLSK